MHRAESRAATGAQQRPLAGLLWMGGAVLGFSAMAIAGRELAGEIAPAEILLWRALIGLGLVTAALAGQGRMAEIRTDRIGLHFLRNLSHFAGQNCWLLAIGLIPLAQVFALEFSYPLLVALLAPLMLGEATSRRRLLTTLTGFAGILLVTRPFSLSSGFSTGFSTGHLAGLGAAAGFAAAALITRGLAQRDSLGCILFWLCLMQSLFAALLCLIWPDLFRWPDPSQWGWLILVALAGLAAQLSLTAALARAPASLVIPVEFLRLPLIAIAGAVLYDEALDPAVLAGGAVVFAANLANLRQPAAKPAEKP